MDILSCEDEREKKHEMSYTMDMYTTEHMCIYHDRSLKSLIGCDKISTAL